jgi:hypothetical protein
MYAFDAEKENLTKALSEQYSQNIISMEEYERLLGYINKIETKKEINIIEKIIQENIVDSHEAPVTVGRDAIIASGTHEKHISLFSWRTTTINPANGNGGEFTSCLGTNRIIVENLPKGKTILNVNSIFGLTEILIRQDMKIINKAVLVFSGIFMPDEINGGGKDLPELHITGTALFGNVTIKRV